MKDVGVNLQKLTSILCPAGFESYNNFQNSPIFSYMTRDIETQYQELAAAKPVRRLVFDGPLVFMNFYREG